MEIAQSCPALPLLAEAVQIGMFLMISADDALLYAKCQAKHGAVVKAYNDARDSAIKTNQVGSK